MRIDELPQEPSILDGHLRACYVKNAQGHYEIATSKGWEVERIANQLAVADINAHIEQALADVRAGKVSPLAYHMARAHMDARLLAAHSGFWVWQVKRHLQPKHFQRLPDKHSRRYADALGIDVATLTGTLPD
jgi:hypothetical protein